MPKNISFKIDDELHIKLKLFCVKQNINIKDYILQLIETELTKEENKNEETSDSKQ
jgi:hypothetical protein